MPLLMEKEVRSLCRLLVVVRHALLRGWSCNALVACVLVARCWRWLVV